MKFIKSYGEIEARDVSSRLDMTAEQRKNTRPDIDRTDVVFAERGASFYSNVDLSNDTEGLTLKQQIGEASELLNKMSVVKTVKLNNVDFKSKSEAKKWVNAQLSRWGGQIDRQNFGIIYFSKANIDYAVEHLSDKYQQSALCLLPYVLKKGVQIGEHNDHKLRKKHTITLGAPIEINGVRGNMGVVVNLNGNKLYASRVLLTDGSLFVFSEETEKASLGLYRGVPINESLANTTNDTFVGSISLPSENVNKNSFKTDSKSQYRDETISQEDVDTIAQLEAADRELWKEGKLQRTEYKKGFYGISALQITVKSLLLLLCFEYGGTCIIYTLLKRFPVPGSAFRATVYRELLQE